MFWYILQLIFPAIIILLPWLCYGKSGRIMTTFYRRMLFRYSCRKLYILALIQLMLLSHFVYFQATGDVCVLVPSMLWGLFLFSYRKAEKLFDFVSDRRVSIITEVFTMAMLFLPHLYPMAISVAIILLGAAFYPSRLARDTIVRLDKSGDELVRLYNRRF